MPATSGASMVSNWSFTNEDSELPETAGPVPPPSIRVTFDAERADDYPKRYTSMTLHWHITGDVPAKAVERAIQMSRDKYCSVWHSLRADIALDTTFEVSSGPFDSAQG